MLKPTLTYDYVVARTYDYVLDMKIYICTSLWAKHRYIERIFLASIEY